MTTTLSASIPSPSESVWHLGPVPLRAYALCIVAGIIVAIWIGQRRWVARGGSPMAVGDVAIWAVPFGIVGSRVYHVITDNHLYFREGKDPWKVFEIWSGGISIWGAIAGGAVGAWIACRRHGIPLPAMADALAPGILIAQAIGRWGNYFNQELFGKPTDLPWGLEIDEANRPLEYKDAETFQPTFLYESLWALAVALLLIWLDRRYKVGHGRLFAMYVAGYTLGRSLFEALRIDDANEILGLRVNQWVSAAVFLGAVAYIVISRRKRPGREDPATLWGTYPRDDADSADGDEDAAESGNEDERPAETSDDDAEGAEETPEGSDEPEPVEVDASGEDDPGAADKPHS